MARIVTEKPLGGRWEIVCTERQVRGWIEILKQRFKKANVKRATIEVFHDSGDKQTIRWEKPENE